MIRVVLVPGHSLDAPGAGVAPWTEYQLHRHTAAHACSVLVAAGIDARVLHRTDRPMGYASKLRDLTSRINRLAPALVVECHYNAGPVGIGQTLALHWPGSAPGRRLASAVSASVSECLGTTDRGAIAQSESSSGLPLYLLRSTACPAVILETHHMDDTDTHELAILAAQDGALGAAVARGILAWMEPA